jgi:hypothetical protein
LKRLSTCRYDLKLHALKHCRHSLPKIDCVFLFYDSD